MTRTRPRFSEEFLAKLEQMNVAILNAEADLANEAEFNYGNLSWQFFEREKRNRILLKGKPLIEHGLEGRIEGFAELNGFLEALYAALDEHVKKLSQRLDEVLK